MGITPGVRGGVETLNAIVGLIMMMSGLAGHAGREAPAEGLVCLLADSETQGLHRRVCMLVL